MNINERLDKIESVVETMKDEISSITAILSLENKELTKPVYGDAEFLAACVKLVGEWLPEWWEVGFKYRLTYDFMERKWIRQTEIDGSWKYPVTLYGFFAACLLEESIREKLEKKNKEVKRCAMDKSKYIVHNVMNHETLTRDGVWSNVSYAEYPTYRQALVAGAEAEKKA